ncbi:MAG: type II toxin-antitoxin system VapC family toxin [Opitutales bacterium]|nr:type II toxin-antitoxin system VapC family toxin [Opitutales bacterium]NRA26709.1 type II toxin-antitoxin system VapC family toxin [Opitutales bacterium]
MIAVDTSIILAVLMQESDAAQYVQKLEQETELVIAAGTYVELGAVMNKKSGPRSLQIVDAFLEEAEIEISPMSSAQARIARDAYYNYSILNFGDCFSYALAKEKKIPLLYKGNDFSKTDIISAI